MSLPDTVFIFVLALIIFGPKKLPEIGRQIGRLVGEFRRASNEFKFQIEEELRQAERNETSAPQNSIAAPRAMASAEDADLSLSAGETSGDPLQEISLSESVPAGQRPNPDAMQEVVDSASVPVPPPRHTDNGVFGESKLPVSLATITAAVGAQARLTVPYAPVFPTPAPPPAEPGEDSTDSAAAELHSHNGASGDAPSISGPGHSASSEAEIHHG